MPSYKRKLTLKTRQKKMKKKLNRKKKRRRFLWSTMRNKLTGIA